MLLKLAQAKSDGIQKNRVFNWRNNGQGKELGCARAVGVRRAANRARPDVSNGASSTFGYPIYAQWFDDYAKVDPGARFNYQSIGSGGGIVMIRDKTVVIGASDAQEKLKKSRSRRNNPAGIQSQEVKAMVVKKHVRIGRFVGLAAGVATLLAACGPAASYAQTAANPIAAASEPADPPMNSPAGADPAAAKPGDPPPKVENCAVVTISTPPKYACNGKVYTSYELQHLREKWEAAHK